MNNVALHPNHPDAMVQEFDFVPPHDLEFEQHVLAAVLYDNRAHAALAGWLRPEHFFSDAHRRIYAAAEALIERGEPANVVSLRNRIADAKELEHIGGAEYLARLVQSVVTVRDVDHYGRLVKALAMRRDVLAAADDLRALALDGNAEDPGEIVARAEQRVAAIGSGAAVDDGQFEAFETAIEEAMASADAAHKGGHALGLSTGIKDLDHRLGRLQKQRLILLAARPSMGKSALALQVARNVAAAGARVAFVSLEMPGADLAQRLIADQAGVSYTAMQNGTISDADMQRMVLAQADLKRHPLLIRAAGPRDLAAIRSAVRRAGRDKPVDLLVIDYLQLIRPTGNYRGNKVNEVGEISAGLKEMAVDLDMPIIALSQLSRAVEGREDKRPTLADLRDSGALEQDADTIGFLYREEYYVSRKPASTAAQEADRAAQLADCRGVCEVIVAKRRMGPVGTAKLYFDPALNRFRDLADRPDDRQMEAF